MVRSMVALSKTATILLMSSDPELAIHVQQALAPYGFVVRTAQGAQACQESLRNYPADLLLLTSPEGLALCRQLRIQGHEVPIIVLVDEDNVDSRVAALDAGASDLVPQPFDASELLFKVRSQVIRAPSVNSHCLRFQDLLLNCQTREVLRGERAIELTGKEFDLLRFLLENPQQVLTREQILHQVWGADFPGESNIIEVYIRYLRLKLEREGDKKLIQTVRGVGYALRD
ncbi:response regulator transcription factor [Anthocerotibacter panamensis]|uniref:response regulator transcription factor n=1 Tax=Anthocerotibacter panamensis TaxID=2857077 RepID=UPI001C4087EC|nr:response regulator transcription factor [Anthocerotibacter panamensis]